MRKDFVKARRRLAVGLTNTRAQVSMVWKRDPHWSEARAKALKRHLYAMTKRVLGSVRANVLCGDEEAGKETVSEGEIADPELDAL